MIPYHPTRDLVQLGAITLQTEPIFSTVSYIVFGLVFVWQAKKIISTKKALGIYVILLATAMFGGRLWYHLDEGLPSFFAIFNPAVPGLTSFGVIAGGIIGFIAVGIWMKKEGIKKMFALTDAAAPAFALGVFIYRIGCMIYGDVVGKVSSRLPWLLLWDGNLRHPTAAYLSLLGLVLFGVIMLYKKRYVGQLADIAFLGYFGGRFLLEFTRQYPGAGFISPAQWIMLAFIVCYIVWMVVRKRSLGHFLTPEAALLDK